MRLVEFLCRSQWPTVCTDLVFHSPPLVGRLAKSLLYVIHSIAQRYYILIRATELPKEGAPSNAFANSPRHDGLLGCCRLALSAKATFSWARGVHRQIRDPRQPLCGIGRSSHKATQNVHRQYFPKLSPRRYCRNIVV